MKKIWSIQALRGIAFLGIFTHHYQSTSLGAWGVSIFFMLSGYLMWMKYNDLELDATFIGCIKFAIKKIKKLYLLHIIMLFASVVICGGNINFSALLCNLFLVQSLIPDMDIYYSYNPVSWYLSATAVIYFIFPLILKLLKQIHNTHNEKVYIILVMIFQIMLAYSSYVAEAIFFGGYNISYWLSYICPFFRVGDFIIGSLLCMWIHRIRDSRAIRWSRLYILLFEVSAIVYSVAVHYLYVNKAVYPDIMWITASIIYLPSSMILLIIFSDECNCVISRVVRNRFWYFLGEYSAIGFLIHYDGIIILKKICIVIGNPGFRGVIIFGLVMMVSVLYKYIYDKYIYYPNNGVIENNR